MTAPLDCIHSALLSWAYWTGQQDVVSSVRRSHGSFLADSPVSVQEHLEKLAASLYFPPSADVPATTSAFKTIWVNGIYRELARAFHVEVKPFWPEGRPYALVLTHDIDRICMTYQGWLDLWRKREFLTLVRHAANCILRKLQTSETDPFYNFHRILRFEAEQEIKSTFFLLKEKKRWQRLFCGEPQHVFGVYDPEEIREEIEAFKSVGCELGVHASLDAYCSEASITEEKGYLESLWGKVFCGVRTHYLMFAERTPDIFLNQAFTYDSSMGFNFQNGFRCGTCFPFLLCHDRERDLWEFPLIIMDTALRSEAKANSKCGGIEDIAAEVMRVVTETKGLAVINWHQRYVNAEQAPDLFGVMERTIVQAKRDGAWITTPSALFQWWTDLRLHCER